MLILLNEKKNLNQPLVFLSARFWHTNVFQFAWKTWIRRQESRKVHQQRKVKNQFHFNICQNKRLCRNQQKKFRWKEKIERLKGNQNHRRILPHCQHFDGDGRRQRLNHQKICTNHPPQKHQRIIEELKCVRVRQEKCGDILVSFPPFKSERICLHKKQEKESTKSWISFRSHQQYHIQATKINLIKSCVYIFHVILC